MFTGPHCDLRASWYDAKNVAFTWNCMDVRAKGKIKFTDDEGTKEIIESLSNQYELFESEAAFDKLTAEYAKRMSKAINGFQIKMERLEVIFKLSQIKDEVTRKQII